MFLNRLWYFASKEGKLKRKTYSKLNYEKILESFLKNVP